MAQAAAGNAGGRQQRQVGLSQAAPAAEGAQSQQQAAALLSHEGGAEGIIDISHVQPLPDPTLPPPVRSIFLLASQGGSKEGLWGSGASQQAGAGDHALAAKLAAPSSPQRSAAEAGSPCAQALEELAAQAAEAARAATAAQLHADRSEGSGADAGEGQAGSRRGTSTSSKSSSSRGGPAGGIPWRHEMMMVRWL